MFEQAQPLSPGVDAQPSPLVRTLAYLGPDFSLFLLFLGIFGALAIGYGAHFHVAGEGSIAIAGGIGAGLVGVRFVWRAPAILGNIGDERARFYAAARRILRDWGPLILLVVVFENLHAYTGLIRKVPIDDKLYAFDVRVFGVEPSAWIGKYAHPLLTDWFALAYGMYFVLPMILATFLSVRGRRVDFRELATSVVLHMCIGFLFFIIFPAGPPRFYPPLVHGGFHPAQLQSYFGLWEWSQGAWDTVNPVSTNSSFPSMHCAIAMMTLLYGWRFGSAVFPRHPRLFFWLCLPVVVSLWISTVYLRHHWVPDCLAGMVLGVICFKVTPVLRRRWPGAEAAALT
ncbi:MAG TPA: phosphatase PAP2 family protein [Kofleriaceae bacterium]|nr:phosphatase PAP2 family protein [Kofleriaceae bacterium]